MQTISDDREFYAALTDRALASTGISTIKCRECRRYIWTSPEQDCGNAMHAAVYWAIRDGRVELLSTSERRYGRA